MMGARANGLVYVHVPFISSCFFSLQQFARLTEILFAFLLEPKEVSRFDVTG